MKRAALLLSLALSACPTPSPADTWGVATISSYHSRCCYNQQNSGAGVEIGVAENMRVIGGFYRNSINATTEYLGVSYTPWRWGLARFGANFGGGTGYDKDDSNRVLPMVVPVVQIEHGRIGVNFGSVLTKHSGLVVGLQMKFKFKE